MSDEPKTYENAAPSGFQDWLKPRQSLGQAHRDRMARLGRKLVQDWEDYLCVTPDDLHPSN